MLVLGLSCVSMDSLSRPIMLMVGQSIGMTVLVLIQSRHHGRRYALHTVLVFLLNGSKDSAPFGQLGCNDGFLHGNLGCNERNDETQEKLNHSPNPDHHENENDDWEEQVTLGPQSRAHPRVWNVGRSEKGRHSKVSRPCSRESTDPWVHYGPCWRRHI